MYTIKNILAPERTLYSQLLASKKRVLEFISELLAKKLTDAEQDEIFSALLTREKLGSTAIGHGIAIPHIRCQWTDQPIGIFLHLRDGIDFDAIDQENVDLVFALIVPEEATEDHLKLLAALAKLFSQADLRNKLREASNDSSLYEIITQAEQND